MIRPRKHKKCHNKGGGSGMCNAKCFMCNENFVYQSGPNICEGCLVKNNLCYICGKEIKGE